MNLKLRVLTVLVETGIGERKLRLGRYHPKTIEIMSICILSYALIYAFSLDYRSQLESRTSRGPRWPCFSINSLNAADTKPLEVFSHLSASSGVAEANWCPSSAAAISSLRFWRVDGACTDRKPFQLTNIVGDIHLPVGTVCVS